MCSSQHARQGGSDYVDALCALLLLQALPSSALWGIGWLLLQVLGLRKAGGALSCLALCLLCAASYLIHDTPWCCTSAGLKAANFKL